jgi:hypothetical protein
MQREGSLLCSQQPATGPFLNNIVLLRCDALKFGKLVPTHRMNLLPATSA